MQKIASECAQTGIFNMGLERKVAFNNDQR